MTVHDKSGHLLGEICDICIQRNGKVSHLIMQKRGLLRKKWKLPIQVIRSFVDTRIVLEKESQLEKYEENDQEFTMYHCKPLAKIYAHSQHGEQLGLLDDVYFLEKVGTIIGYELTDGFFSDITQGKRVIRTPHPPKIGKDAMIVSVT